MLAKCRPLSQVLRERSLRKRNKRMSLGNKRSSWNSKRANSSKMMPKWRQNDKYYISYIFIKLFNQILLSWDSTVLVWFEFWKLCFGYDCLCFKSCCHDRIIIGIDLLDRSLEVIVVFNIGYLALDYRLVIFWYETLSCCFIKDYHYPISPIMVIYIPIISIV